MKNKNTIGVGKKPMPHQVSAINKTISYFSYKYNSRGKINMACGTGKSLTSYWILKELTKVKNIKRTLITVPNLILENQMFQTFHSELSKTHNFICIGSDKDILINIEESANVTTQPDEIKSFLKNNNNKPTVVIATYQSLGTLSEICKELNYDFDLAIIDEAHRTVGGEYKYFSSILFDTEIKIKKRLFMTATEKIYSGNDDNVIAMDNVDFYGKKIYEYTLLQAIKDNILCNYKVYGLSTKEEYDVFIKLNSYLNDITDKIKLSEQEKENIIYSLIAIINSINKNGSKKIVTYHSTIHKAKLFNSLLDSIVSHKGLNIKTFHINGNQNGKERNENMNGFKNANISILTNSQALVEGVDIPCIDCIVFCDKRESTISIIQAIGRGLRKFKGKKYCSIIIPALLSKSSDDGINKDSSFYKLGTMLMSLSYMDGRIIHEVKEIRNSNGGKYIRKKDNILQFDIDAKFIPNFNKNFDKITLRVLRSNKELYLNYEEAKKWVQTNTLTENIKLSNEWNNKITKKLPPFISKTPYFYYRKLGAWKGWGDFLGTGNYKQGYFLNYQEAKKWVRENTLTKNINSTEWLTVTNKLPSFIPKAPDGFYSREGTWKGWSDFLGTSFLSYKEAKEWVKSNPLTKNIKLQPEWARETKKLPKFIPKNPPKFYKNKGWINWCDFLGKVDFFIYEEAKKWVKKSSITKNIKLKDEWNNKITKKLPPFIPKTPNGYYRIRGTWKGWGDFLGTGNKKGGFYSYNEAKKWVQTNTLTENIKLSNEWNNKITKKLPPFIPKSPSSTYKKQGWISWGDFLETGTRGDFFTYNEAKKWVQENELTKNIKTIKQWGKITKKLPSFIPKNPIYYYKLKGTWKDWYDFLGK